MEGFGGGRVSCNQKIEANVKIYRASLYVVGDGTLPVDVLLGTDVLCKNENRLIIEEVVCYVESVDEETEGNDRPELINLFSKFPGCFSTTMANLGRYNRAAMEIQLTSTVPIN